MAMEFLCDQCSTTCLKLSRGFERVRKRQLYVREKKKEWGGGSISETK